MRGGLTIGAGIIAGNIIGFVRVALTAYLLGTHSQADSLAVAVGPLDALNSVLINTMVFAFVPMLTARQGADRTALFLKLNQWFAWLFSLVDAGHRGGRALADHGSGARPRPALLSHLRHHPAHRGVLHHGGRRGGHQLRLAIYRTAGSRRSPSIRPVSTCLPSPAP